MELTHLLSKYLSDHDAVKIKAHLSKNKVRYVLAELDRLKVKDISEADREIIKDIFFYYG
jgi:hypothetical protein